MISYRTLTCVVMFFALTCASAAFADSSLVGRWTMQPEDGDKVRDEGPHGLHGELRNGATVEEGRNGGKAVRVGEGQAQIRLPQSGQIDRATDAVSFTAWINIDRRPTEGGAVVVTKRPAWHSPAPYVLLVTENGGLTLDANDGNAWFHARSPGGKVRPGQWHHVAFTYDTQDGLDLFVDGERVAGAGAREALQRNGHRIVLGHEEGSQHVRRSPFEGLIGETRLYAAKLSAEEVRRDIGGTVIAQARRQTPAQTRGGQARVLDDGRLRAEIVFDAEPAEMGLTFARSGVEAATVTVDGVETRAWKVKHGSSPSAGWLRSLYLTFSDDRFRQGSMPAVDVEVEFLYDEQAGFDIRADTMRGDVRVGGTWGGRNRWRTVRARVDDGFFGGREHQGAGQGVDGYDLRINGANGDWYVRRITVTGYDLEDQPDFARLVKVDGVSAPDRPIFLYKQGETSELDFKVRNVARKAMSGRYVASVTSRDGQTVARVEEEMTLGASDVTTLTLPFDTSGLALGVYETRLEIFHEGVPEPVLTRTGSIGVRSDTEIAKASDDEYWFGLDPQLGLPDQSEAMREWMRVMGVDVIRLGLDANNVSRGRQAIETLRGDDLRFVLMLDVPKEIEREAFERSLDRVARLAGELAAEYRFPFWELGNEPDLPFFFPASIDQYLEGYYKMYEAIKAADPETRVMNGGLANAEHLQVSMDRTREFIEKIDPDRIDIFAYHAHGAGVQAERNSLNRIRRLATEFGKSDLPMMDTETGLAARGPDQEMTQAATAVQKTVFAMSQGHPTLLWFRLLFEHTDSYGNLHTRQEPRPTVLSYRAMVETLRGYAFKRLIDMESPGLEGYLFEQIDGDGRVAVLWSNEPDRRDVALRLADAGGDVHGGRQLDLFGNPESLVVRGDGVAEVLVTERPTFVTWQAGVPADRVAIAAPVLDLTGVTRIVAGRENPGVIRVRNPLDREIRATLDVRAEGDLDVRVDPGRSSITLSPGQTHEIPVTLHAGQDTRRIVWPNTWSLYAPLPSPPTLGAVREVPSQIAGVQAKQVTAVNHEIDVAPHAAVRERADAVLVAEIESAADQTVTFGASADWWMAVYVNGEKVYDTLATGNGSGFRFTDHTFEAKLRRGTNLVAFHVQSGSHGWKLVTADPREVERAVRPDTPADRLEVTLSDGQETLAHQTAGLTTIDPLPRVTDAGSLIEMPPLAVLGEANVDNPHFVFPDATMWYAGERDLSARLWAGFDDHHLHLVVRVRDDEHYPPATSDDLETHDSIRIGLADRSGSYGTLDVAEVDGHAIVAAQGRLGLVADARVERDEAQKVTVYRLSIARPESRDLLLNVEVRDRDAVGFKQTLRWLPGMAGEGVDPLRWQPVATD